MIKALARTLFTAVVLLFLFASSALGVRALRRETSHADRRQSHHRHAGRLSRHRSVAVHRAHTTPATPRLPAGPPEPVTLTPPTESTPQVEPTTPATATLPVGPPGPVEFTPPAEPPPVEPPLPAEPPPPVEPPLPTEPPPPVEPPPPTEPSPPTEPPPPVEPPPPTEPSPPTEPTPPVEPLPPSPPPAPTAPVNSAPPTIVGTATEGHLLSATIGAWAGSPTSYAYQWRDCGATSTSCTNVSGATGSSYTLGSSDVGHTMRVVVTASNAGGATPAASASVGPVSAPLPSPAPFRFFSSTSFWNETLPADAPLDTSSAAIVGALDGEVAAEEEAKKGPTINTTSWSVPIYTVPAGQPTVKVTLAGASSAALQAAWDAVPLPANAQPAAGSDKHLVVWQPSAGRLWEFWGLEHTTNGWRAAWGGAIKNAASNSGAYGPEAWAGAMPGWGASASSLSIAGGLITLEDLAKGQINHALAMAVPDTRAGVYAAPAQRTDGFSTEPTALPEGAHLRLDPTLDLAALHLPRLTLMIAEAAQRYGILVRDRASNVVLYAQDPTPTGTNPYLGQGGYFEGRTSQYLLADFPWSHLQLLKMELHSSP